MQDNISEIYVFIITGILLFGILAGFIIFFVITYYKKQQENAREKHLLQTKFNEDLLKSTFEIQEKAFDDISRELHDNIGQQLSAASIYLNLLLKEKDNSADSKLQSCRDIITGSLQDLRHISQTLLGEKIRTTGIIHSVQLEIDKINKLGICTGALKTTNTPVSLDPKKEIILFRIIQEAISNATKHAPGCHIEITIDPQQDNLRVYIKDNGKGFFPENIIAPGIGLINMKSRAKTIGASYELKSAEGEGTAIEIILNTESGGKS